MPSIAMPTTAIEKVPKSYRASLMNRISSPT